MATSGETIRAFIAVEFSAGTRQALGRVTDALAKAGPPRAVSWVKPQLLHLTLKFLGETPLSAIPKIETALAGAATGQQAFGVQTSGLGCFPNLKRPRVIWVGFDRQASTRLSALNEAVERVVSPLGFPTEARPFSPHLTLGRVRKEAAPDVATRVGLAVQGLKEVPVLTDSIESIVLIKSELLPGGPVYTPLFRVTLGGG